MLRNLDFMLGIFCLFIIGMIVTFFLSIYGIVYGRKKGKKGIKRLGIVACIITGVFLIIYGGVEGFYIWKMNSYKSIDNVGQYNYEVILGGGLNGKEPGGLLEGRLNKGIEYLNEYPNAKAIVSGGQGSNEEISEAEAMKNYMVAHGINKNRIIEEDKSNTTVQNIVNSEKILKSLGVGNDTMLIVSNEFHLCRAQIIADYLGIKNVGIASKSEIKLKMAYTVLAFPSTVKSLISAERYKNII